MKYTGLPITDRIKMYHTMKKELEKQEKEVTSLGREIKEFLLSEDLTEMESGDIIASIVEINKDCLDEERIIHDFIEEFPQIVKTKVYIDADEFENLVYTRQISPERLEEYIIHKDPVIRLNIRKRKEAKDGTDNNDSGNTENYPQD